MSQLSVPGQDIFRGRTFDCVTEFTPVVQKKLLPFALFFDSAWKQLACISLLYLNAESASKQLGYISFQYVSY